MTDCPALDELEAVRPSAAIRAHVAACAACRMVVELIDERSFAIAVRTGPQRPTPDAGCAQVEPLLAARDDGELAPDAAATLAAHLARCADCCLLVERFAPDAETAGDHVELPVIETSAYALGAEVARGGMGRILAARDLRVGRQVAVKELLGRSPALAARFEREARVTARLQHPGIVPIYEIGTWPDGTPFYSMRLVEGRTLREALKTAPTLDARLALLPAVIAATEAVAFAHSRHVIHRDLTPSNILVGAFGETVVIDWGLAKDLADPDAAPDSDAGGTVDLGLTGSGQVIGTAMYMPPEQARGEAVDERADVYALGAILYHLLAGTWPYGGRRAEVLAQVVAGPPRPIDAVAPGAPRDLISIVTKAMARTPADRYASARELAEELVRFQTGRLVEAHVYSRRELWRRWLRRHRAALAATAAALIAIAIAATISVGRVVTERDRAEAERARLLEEQGRQELLAGNPMRAAAWLSAAYSAGSTTESLRFLLGTAMRDIELVDRTLDCGHEAQNLELDPAGTRLLAACGTVVKVWRVADGAELVALSAPGAELANAGFSHDGATIATWGPDGIARLWDAATGALRRELRHGVHIFNAAFTPDDRRVVTFGFDGNARVWSVADGAAGLVLAVSKGLKGVRGTIAPDGITVATVTSDGRASAWSLDTGVELGTIEHGASIVGGNIARDGTRGSTCGADRTAKVWDLRTGPSYGKLIQTMAAHTDSVLTCEFSPDGRMLTTSQDGTAKVWDIASGRVLTSVSVGGVVADGRFSPDGTRFTTVRLDGWLRVWATDTGALIAAQDDPGGAIPNDRSTHLFSADGTQLFAARKDGSIRALDLRRTRLRLAFTPANTERIIGATADGSRVATRNDDHATAWDTATGRPVTTVTIPPPTLGETTDEMAAVGLAQAAAVTQRGAFSVGVGADAVARVRDGALRELASFPIARLAPTVTEQTYQPAIGSARFAPDGGLVIVSTAVAVWDLSIEQRSAHAIAAIIANRVPWRIVGGELVERP